MIKNEFITIDNELMENFKKQMLIFCGSVHSQSTRYVHFILSVKSLDNEMNREDKLRYLRNGIRLHKCNTLTKYTHTRVVTLNELIFIYDNVNEDNVEELNKYYCRLIVVD